MLISQYLCLQLEEPVKLEENLSDFEKIRKIWGKKWPKAMKTWTKSVKLWESLGETKKT